MKTIKINFINAKNFRINSLENVDIIQLDKILILLKISSLKRHLLRLMNGFYLIQKLLITTT